MNTFSLFNIPNTLTLSRVGLIIPIYLLLEKGFFFIAFFLLTFSILTDFFDGWLARKLLQETQIGALLDPICDKFIVLFYFALLFLQSDVLPIWFVALTYTRNISQLMAIPILSWWLKIPFHVKPKLLPKYGSALSFIIILTGTILAFGNFPTEWQSIFLKTTSWVLIPLSALLETYILVTYLPRLIQIATGRHDTFE